MLFLNSRDLEKRSLSLSVFHFKLAFSSVAPPLEKGILGQVFFQTWCSAQKLSNPLYAVSTAGPRGSVVCYMRCVLQVVIMKTKAVFTKGCVAALSVAGIIKHVEKSSLREKAFVSGSVPAIAHPGKEVTMAGGRMSWSHGIPKQMLQAYAQLAFPGY